MVITLFVIAVLGFVIVHSAPGSPFEDTLDPKANPTANLMKIKQHKLDRPLYEQFITFYGEMFRDFGVLIGDVASDGSIDSADYVLKSYKTNDPVVPTMFRRALITLPLVIISLLIMWTLAFPVGIYSAMRRGSLGDRSITLLSYALISIPSFWLALLVIRFLTEDVGIPIVGAQTLSVELDGVQGFMDGLWHAAIPGIIAGLAGIAVMSRYVKGQMLEVLSADYVRTARAKGLDQDSVNYKHALRNASLPFITMLAGILPMLFSGSVVMESIYGWPGLGRWIYGATMTKDYSIVIATLFVTSALTLVGMLISDILLVVADPRIKLG